jgi:hypothetical protein
MKKATTKKKTMSQEERLRIASEFLELKEKIAAHKEAAKSAEVELKTITHEILQEIEAEGVNGFEAVGYNFVSARKMGGIVISDTEAAMEYCKEHIPLALRESLDKDTVGYYIKNEGHNVPGTMVVNTTYLRVSKAK